MVTISPTILSLPLTYGVPFSLKSQSVTDKDAWLCRNAVKWALFWPFLFVFCGVFTMVLNFMNWYMFMNRLSKFVQLRLQSDDSFITFYSSKYIPGINTEISSDWSTVHSMRSMTIPNGHSSTTLSMDITAPQTPTPNTPNGHSRHHSEQISGHVSYPKQFSPTG